MPSLQKRTREDVLYRLEVPTAYELNLTIVMWYDKHSPASVGHPGIQQYRIRHQFMPVRTSESSHNNLMIMP
jgi:hypothetical protein